jgi:hypothetical protein
MMTPLSPLDTVLLAEALDVVAAETEAAHARERTDREMRAVREIVDRMAAEGKSLEEIAQAVGARVGAPAEWIVESVRGTIAEIKELLAGGTERLAVVETIAERLEASPEEILLAVDSCAREMGEGA